MFIKSIGFILSVLALAALACGLSIGSQERTSRNDYEAPRSTPAEGGAESGAKGDDQSFADAEQGEALFHRLGCSGCHTGASQPAPSLEGVYGKEVTLEGGQTVVGDDAYLRQAILEPRSQLVEGYEPIMPEYGDQLGNEQVDALVAYIRSLSH